MRSDRTIELAEGPNYAVLATQLPSGHPQTHVMWVDTDGEHLLVNTVIGRKNTIDGDVAWDHINQLSEKYFDAPFGGPRLDRVIVKIRPDRVIEHRS